MKKINRRISLLMLLFLCLLGEGSTGGKSVSEVKAEVDTSTTSTDSQIISLFDQYSDGIDGAYTEKYASDLYAAYQSTDDLDFIRLLSQQKVKRIKPIVNLLVSEVMNSADSLAIKEFTANTEKLLNTKDLNEREKYLVYEVYTSILYYRITL